VSHFSQAGETEVASVSYVESVATSISEEYLGVYDALATRR